MSNLKSSWEAAFCAALLADCTGTIDFGDEEASLMDVKIMVLGIFIKDGPFLSIVQLHSHIGAILVKDLVVDKERRLLRIH